MVLGDMDYAGSRIHSYKNIKADYFVEGSSAVAEDSKTSKRLIS